MKRSWPGPGDRLEEPQERAAALGANAVVGIDIDYEVGQNGSMPMVSISGTAVVV